MNVLTSMQTTDTVGKRRQRLRFALRRGVRES